MKIVIATATIAMLAAGAAWADVRPDQISGLLEQGTIKPFETLNQAALAKHGGATIYDTELEHEHGRYVYQVELRDNQGTEWEVELDATTGEVLSDRQDN